MSSVAQLRAVLGRGYFRRLYVTRLSSQTSDGILQAGLAAYVFFSPEQQATPEKVAAAFAVLLLPYSLIGPFAGVFLDRWRRRQVLVYANLVRCVLVGTLASLVLTGETGLAFFGTALAVLSVNRFFLAALSAALPHVVTRRQLIMANSVSTTSGTVVAFLGGGVGYGLRWIFGADAPGTAAILAVAAGAYLCSSLVATTMGRDRLGPAIDPQRPSLREQLRDAARGLRAGARHVWRRRPAAAALAAISGHRFCYGVSVVMTLLLYRNYFHPGEAETGLAGVAVVFAASGAGYFLAAVITPPITRRIRKESWVAVLLLSACAVEIAFGAPFRQALLVLAGFALGVVSQGMKIGVDTIVQENIADDYRGWVFSCYDMLFNVSFVSAAAFAAFALPADGKSYAVLGVIAGGYLLTGWLYWLADRAMRESAARADNAAAPEPVRAP